MPPSLASRRAPCRETCPVGARERIFHHRLEIARIVDARVRCLVGHRFGRNEIPAPQLERIEAVFVRRVIDQPLDRIGDVGTAGEPHRTTSGPAERPGAFHKTDTSRAGLAHQAEQLARAGIDRRSAYLETRLRAVTSTSILRGD